MPAASSIYWNSVDSQVSSGGSSGDSNSRSGRQYVDPWDLENYAYLRRHSIASMSYPYPQPHPQLQQRSNRRREQDVRPEAEYCYGPPIREPGYDAPASVEELYFGPPRHPSNACYYHHPIYEDDVPHYATSHSIYAPLSDLDHHSPTAEERGLQEMLKGRHKLSRAKGHRRETCLYHGISSPSLQESAKEIPVHRMIKKKISKHVEVIPSSELDLNTYGHLKIDYTNSWNSLHRKISK
ncbi:uncharacterized protein LOC107272526 [Cephus cinctus]|uniref:Uncharacterized protein LOC107272526 n=1 Tax=Cephus cinctus TaxID=211228 RepID=A0AAJ7C9G2_CEPCN|nr:uncharacterized protein LOC107272526 [Cephus cinctus]